jgi:hypothetical protein
MVNRNQNEVLTNAGLVCNTMHTIFLSVDCRKLFTHTIPYYLEFKMHIFHIFPIEKMGCILNSRNTFGVSHQTTSWDWCLCFRIFQRFTKIQNHWSSDNSLWHDKGQQWTKWRGCIIFGKWKCNWRIIGRTSSLNKKVERNVHAVKITNFHFSQVYFPLLFTLNML